MISQEKKTSLSLGTDICSRFAINFRDMTINGEMHQNNHYETLVNASNCDPSSQRSQLADQED